MSDGRRNRGKKSAKWILLIICAALSPVIGILLDVFVLFPPDADAHGHGLPVFTILLPLLAGFTTVVVLLITAVSAVWKAASARGKHYEYIKSFWKYNHFPNPAVTFHEIDLDAGRCGIRCIELYGDGHVECLVNKGVYAPVPTVDAINAMPDYTAYIITGPEFEDMWNGRSDVREQFYHGR